MLNKSSMPTGCLTDTTHHGGFRNPKEPLAINTYDVSFLSGGSGGMVFA